MTAAEFTGQIDSFSLQESHFLSMGFEKEFAQIMAKGYTFQSLPSISKSSDELINLIKNYNMSNVEIGMMSLYKDLKEDDDYSYFGLFEVDYLAISKKSGEVVMIDHEDKGFIMCKCALNSEKFLDALMVVWRTISVFLTNEEKADDASYRNARVEECTFLAGGEDYHDFYQTVLGGE